MVLARSCSYEYLRYTVGRAEGEAASPHEEGKCRGGQGIPTKGGDTLVEETHTHTHTQVRGQALVRVPRVERVWVLLPGVGYAHPTASMRILKRSRLMERPLGAS